MKQWFNVNLGPLTWIITHGNSVKVAWSQTHLSRISTSHAYACGLELESQTWLHLSFQGILRTKHRQVSNFNECYSIRSSCPLVKKKYIFSQEKTFQYVILTIKDDFKGYIFWLQGDFKITITNF